MWRSGASIPYGPGSWPRAARSLLHIQELARVAFLYVTRFELCALFPRLKSYTYLLHFFVLASGYKFLLYWLEACPCARVARWKCQGLLPSSYGVRSGFGRGALGAWLPLWVLSVGSRAGRVDVLLHRDTDPLGLNLIGLPYPSWVLACCMTCVVSFLVHVWCKNIQK